LKKANLGKKNVSCSSEAWGAEPGIGNIHTTPYGVWLKHTNIYKGRISKFRTRCINTIYELGS